MVGSLLCVSAVTGTSTLHMTGCPFEAGGALVVSAINLDMAKSSACETQLVGVRMGGC